MSLESKRKRTLLRVETLGAAGCPEEPKDRTAVTVSQQTLDNPHLYQWLCGGVWATESVDPEQNAWELQGTSHRSCPQTQCETRTPTVAVPLCQGPCTFRTRCFFQEAQAEGAGPGPRPLGGVGSPESTRPLGAGGMVWHVCFRPG